MNLDLIRNKLSTLNKTGDGEREKIDYEAIFWRPTLGKHQIRIVPSMYNPEYPFSELRFHYVIAKFPMIALSNFGKQDPVEDFVKELRKTSDKENWSLSGKLYPKLRVYAPVIVRGEEAKGVRLWGFGTIIHKALLSLAEDEDIGDYTDPINGYDMIVEQTPGNPYPDTTVRIKPKMVPLSADASQAEKWMKTQPSPLESFKQYDYEFIKNKLETYLAPDGEDLPVTVSAPSVEEKPVEVAESAPSPSPFKVQTKAKASTTSKFDDLFDDDDDSTGLPF
jgi:hypothetical protein